MTPKSREEHIARIRRRRRLIRAGIAHREGMMRRAAAFALCSALMAAYPWGKAAISAQAGESCTAGMVMPVQGSEIIARFDGPYQAWMAGHRGIDIRAQKGDELVAPATGIISHAGTVAGKSTVSIRVHSHSNRRRLHYQSARRCCAANRSPKSPAAATTATMHACIGASSWAKEPMKTPSGGSPRNRSGLYPWRKNHSPASASVMYPGSMSSVFILPALTESNGRLIVGTFWP